ncbi:aminoacyl tRNA synthase complex-interacting multifunctional protein 1a isoform X1 [Polyodon spathula]|uniref:aminoacyl tRNA synthase complex-interacting multifunctional protein 1a isoform X1 n=1 Tax=Polyodon spathula TaxID=7913 RepID=UPI001B7F6093|nr:aminoacyl tRNA synthase complex-interacting multifunctional protein 1a isoform X1 [Polyodon spathula]XP_041117026.1 aminoacyl tRNA synthase complex-interacting multifunctional protein 1a isoform X1 [Polyodon spathula]XP_041117035.1 aminoacyl tRNA synthase complex-interacting multifunctional protein 1a isoform X1 [Polyodon spathula]
MSANNPVLNRLEQRTMEADEIIEYLKQQVLLLKEKAILQASIREEKKLRVENAKLKKDVEELKKQLIEKEKSNGVKQIAVPTAAAVQSSSKVLVSETVKPATSAAPAVLANKEKAQKENEDKKKKKGENKKSIGGEDDSKPVDVTRLDLRVGRIMTAKKHPDADSLYVEEVDVGEATLRTVVSGLVKHVPIEQMQNRMAVLLCNLKAAKMRGVVSQAMVMCASSPDKVEILDPPSGAVPGDRVTFEGFPGEPDKELNPKKKVWEQIQPDLRTDGQCVATYKGAAFEIKGKGVCKAQTMSNSGIK